MGAGRALGRAAGWLGLAITIAFLALAAVLAVLQTRWGGESLRRFVVPRIDEEIRGTIEVGSLRLEGARIVLRDIVLRDPEGELVVRVDRLAADLKLRTLLGRRLEVRRLVIERPLVWLRQDARGVNISRALALREPAVRPGPPEEPSRWRLRLHELDLSDGVFDYVIQIGERTPTLFSVDSIEARGSGSYELGQKAFAFELDLEGEGRASTPGRVKIEGHARGRGRFERGQARIRIGELVALEAHLEGPKHLNIDLKRLVVTPLLGANILPGWPLVVPVETQGVLTLRTTAVKFDLRTRVADGPGWATLEGSIAYDGRSSPDGLRIVARSVDPRQLLGDGPFLPLSLDLSIQPGPLTPDHLTAALALRAPQVRYRGQVFGPILVTGRMVRGVVEQLVAQATVQGAHLDLRGEGSFADVKLEGRLVISSLAAVGGVLEAVRAGAPRLAGRGSLSFSIAGAPREGLHAFAVTLAGQFPRLRAGDLSLRGLRLTLRLPAAQARSARTFVLSARLRAPHALSLDVRGLRTDPPRPEAPLALRLQRVALTYPGVVRGTRVSWRARGQATVAIGSEQLVIEDLVLVSGPQRVALDLVRRGPTLRGALTLSRFRLVSLPAAARGTLGQTRGIVHGQIRIAGSTRSPVLRATLRLQQGRILGLRNLTVDLAARYARRRAEGRFSARAPQVSLEGTFDMPAAWPPPAAAPLSLSARIARLPLGPLLERNHRAVTGQGVLEARVDLAGTAGEPILDLWAEGRDLQIVTRRLPRKGPDRPGAGGAARAFAGWGTVRLRYAEEVGRATMVLRSRDRGFLHVEGQMDIDLSLVRLARAPGKLDLRSRPIKGRVQVQGFDTSWLADLLEGVRIVRGRLSGNVSVTGTLAEPQVEGTIRWENGRVQVSTPDLKPGPPSQGD
jgi:translocation and assembly module TamB